MKKSGYINARKRIMLGYPFSFCNKQKLLLLHILLLVSLSILNVSNTYSQVIRKVSNPTATGFVSYNLYSYPIVYNNKLYVNYTDFVSNGYHIAEYDGISLKVIDNPNSSANNFLGSPVVYNNNLYIPYGGANSQYQLAKFDGSTFSLIPNPTTGLIAGAIKPVVFNQKLYTFYSESSASTNKLVSFDGTSLVIDTDVLSPNGVHSSSGLLTVYNNQLTLSDSGNMVVFKGGVTTKFNSPAGFFQGLNLLEYKPVINNSRLYVNYDFIDGNTFQSSHHIAQFDGFSVTPIANINSQDAGYMGFAFPLNNDVYFNYASVDYNKLQLAKYDGTSISIIQTPDAGEFDIHTYSDYEVTYHNNLYILYKNASGIDQLAKYDGTTLTLIDNPDLGNGFNGSLFTYNDKIYSSYKTASGATKVIAYDGSNFQFVPSADGKNIIFSYPILFNNKLYFSSGGSLAYLDENPVSTTYITAANGNWNNPSSWVGGIVPPAGANVIINHNINCDVNASCSSLTVEKPSGSLTVLTGFKITITH